MQPDLLLINAGEIATLAGFSHRPKRGAELGDAGIIRQGYVAVQGGRILAVGEMAALPGQWRPLLAQAAPVAALGGGAAPAVVDLQGAALLPGLVDPHTHIVYGGDRTGEFKQRIAGATYVEIARAGGGILSTVRATRAATEAELVAAARRRLDRMLLAGTTTAEVKSGYALETAGELKMLAAIAALGRSHPVELVPTFMGAHEVPPEFRHDPEAYVRLVIEEMLPAVARQGIARFNDVFCEQGVFSVEQSRRILEAGKACGLTPRVHADELVAGFGGAEMAAEVGARSADHLLYVSEAGIARMAAAGTMAVLLPGTPFFLMMSQFAPARRLIAAGVPVALATDCNPGSCPVESMQVAIGLACLQLKLTPAEALAAATINAAHVLGMADRIGSVEVGKQADLLILSEPTHEAIPYRFGSNLVAAVLKQGRPVVAGGRILEAV